MASFRYGRLTIEVHLGGFGKSKTGKLIVLFDELGTDEFTEIDVDEYSGRQEDTDTRAVEHRMQQDIWTKLDNAVAQLGAQGWDVIDIRHDIRLHIFFPKGEVHLDKDYHTFWGREFFMKLSKMDKPK